MTRAQRHHIALSDDLGDLQIIQDAASTPVTSASRISLQAIAQNARLLQGVGIDWGTGTGCLAIAAARIRAVQAVFGLEAVAANLATAEHNVALNSVQGRVHLMWADSFVPRVDADRVELDSYRQHVDFVLANPPASDHGDGFEFRRRVMREAREFLKLGGVLFLNVSSQYGQQRVKRLCVDAPGFAHQGLLASTDWVPFDLNRSDLLRCLRLYAEEERRGGLAYAFRDPSTANVQLISARVALTQYETTRGQGMTSPLMQWQTHLFRFDGV